jgi:hypothetical protein
VEWAQILADGARSLEGSETLPSSRAESLGEQDEALVVSAWLWNISLAWQSSLRRNHTTPLLIEETRTRGFLGGRG